MRKAKQMKAEYKRVVTRFGPETRFEVKPVPAAPFRALQESHFERLKSRLLAEELTAVWEPTGNSWVRRAANEAAALAWVTSYPLLVFPLLFQEKAAEALRFAEQQESVRERSLGLLMV